MALKKMTCPNCGANIRGVRGGGQLSCQYCGANFRDESELADPTAAAANTFGDAARAVHKHSKWSYLIFAVVAIAMIVVFVLIANAMHNSMRDAMDDMDPFNMVRCDYDNQINN